MTTRKAGTAPGDATAKNETHGPGNEAPERGMARDAINIALNIFRSSTARYDDHNIELLEWLWGYAHDELGGSKALLCKQIGYDYNIIYKAFTGAMDENDLSAFIADIAELQNNTKNSISLVETIVTKRVSEALDYARDMNAMVSIQGPTGRSKTHTALHWAHNNNHGRSKYIRIPSGCTRRTLVQLLSKKCGIGINGQKTAKLEWRLHKAFNHRHVIIADEAGHLMPRSGTSTSAIEFLRDLHDMCGCGVALIFTDVYLNDMKHGRLSDYFEQFIGRIKFEVTIPTAVLRGECSAIVKSFTPEPSLKLQQLAYSVAQNRDGKLRTLFEDLQRAKDWAHAHGKESISFNDLLKAVEWRKSGGIWPED
ncbi:MAG: AAA family ATPase [Victivallaceae bacterium]|nr:AAA family ATPase [Victivallaceae bacterium]